MDPWSVRRKALERAQDIIDRRKSEGADLTDDDARELGAALAEAHEMNVKVAQRNDSAGRLAATLQFELELNS